VNRQQAEEMMKSLIYGIGDESIKCVRGNRSRAAITPERSAFYQKHIRLTSARRDDVSFQVLLQADEDFVLAVTDSTVFHPQIESPVIRVKAAAIPDDAVEITFRIEGFIEDDDRWLKADLLLHDESILVSRGCCQPVWVDIKIPENCELPKVEGEIILLVHTLFGDEQIAGRMSFTIDVIDVLMPLPKDFSFYLDLWQHNTNLARTHAVPLWSDGHFAIIERYLKSMAEIGQKVITVVVSEVPWAGQFCFDVKSHLSNLFEYSMIPVEKGESGRLEPDYSVLDRYVQTCLSMGIDREIEVIGLVSIWCRENSGFERFVPDYPDAIRIRYFDRKDGTYKYCREGREIREYIRLLEAHMKEMGWIDIVRIMADEPADSAQYRLSIDAVKESAPAFRLKAAINHTSFIQSFGDDIDDFVMLVGCMMREWDIYSKMKSEGRGHYIWYTCCGNTPDSCLRAPLLESRFVGWLTAYLGLEGFLRWNYTVWPDDPTRMIYWNSPIFPAGENCFVYPGDDGCPVFSLRFMHLRKGIRDFELIRLVRENCPNHEELLGKAFRRIIKSDDITRSGLGEGRTSADIFSLSCEDYETAKRELLTALASSSFHG
jgi:hypothetical protein